VAFENKLSITKTVALAKQELQFRFSRSGGPGGQNVNTRDTKVEVIFDVANSPSLGPRQRSRIIRNLKGRLDADGKLRVVASEERTQGNNRDLAVDKLKTMLAEALRPDPAPRRPTKPTRGSTRRRLESKRVHGRLKRQRSFIGDE